MRNIDFIRLHSKWKSLSGKTRKIPNPDYQNKLDVEYLYEGYAVKEAYSLILEIYKLAKNHGLTEEQRSHFFELIRKHNDFTRGSISKISNSINHLKNDAEYFEESELGACAGSYSLGFDEPSAIENLSKLYQSFSKCFFTIKGEHIIADKSQRVTMAQTMQKWREFEVYVFDDTIMPHSPSYREDLPF